MFLLSNTSEMKEKRCPYCLSINVIKKGMNKKRTKRRYACKGCSTRFVEGSEDYFIDQEKIKPY